MKIKNKIFIWIIVFIFFISCTTSKHIEELEDNKNKIENTGAGGLSGKPLTQKSTEIIKYIVEKSQHKIPIIAVGGIMSADDAIEKIKDEEVLKLFLAIFISFPRITDFQIYFLDKTYSTTFSQL